MKPWLYKVAGAWGTRRTDAFVGHHTRPRRCGGGAVRAAPAGADAGGDARRAGGDRARLLRLPPLRLESVRTQAEPGATPTARG
ncbi:hypothetical protein AB5I41_20110 [Sphingomonas sp. MMS24-JH45]